MAGVAAEDPRALVSTLKAAVGLAERVPGAHCWEIAPVNRTSGGQRRWYGLAGGAQTGFAWAPLASADSRPKAGTVSIKGARPKVGELTAEQLDKLPPMPVAQAGFWAFRFLSKDDQVLDLDVVIDPRHAQEGATEAAQSAPAPASGPELPPVYGKTELQSELLQSLRVVQENQQRAMALALNSLETSHRLNTQTVETALQATQQLHALSSGYVAENMTLRDKVDKLSEANTSLYTQVAQLENESAGFKMLENIYSGPTGAKEFSDTVQTLFHGTLDALKGEPKDSNKG